jgi:hypothetical protein
VHNILAELIVLVVVVPSKSNTDFVESLVKEYNLSWIGIDRSLSFDEGLIRGIRVSVLI